MLKNIDSKFNFGSITDTRVSLLIYFLFSIFLFTFFKYTARQDLISYLSISEKYFYRDFHNAINGVWGPLISWLMVPLYYTSINPIISFKFLQIVIGAFALVGIIKMFEIIGFPRQVKFYLIATTILIIEYYLYLSGTPDLLFACILIYLTLAFLKWNFVEKQIGLYSGILGALLYFAKPLGFPLFIVLFTFFNLLFYGPKKNFLKLATFKNLVNGFTIFCILILPWIYFLSLKYESLTISTGGEYNFAIIGPKYNGVHLPRIETLFEPVNKSATSYWEDPSFLNVESWNPLASMENFFHLLKVIYYNTIKVFIQLLKFSPFFPLFIFFIKPKSLFKDRSMKIMIFVGLVYILIFLFLFIEARFFIIVQFISLIISAKYIVALSSEYKSLFKYKQLLYILFALSVCIQPIYSLIKHFDEGKILFKTAETLNQKEIVSVNIASISTDPLKQDWGSTLTLSYLLKSKYFGEIDKNLDDEIIYTELKKFDISYLFVWAINREFENKYFNMIFKDSLILEHSIFSDEITKYLIIYKIN